MLDIVTVLHGPPYSTWTPTMKIPEPGAALDEGHDGLPRGWLVRAEPDN